MKPLKCDFCSGNLVMDASREFATCEFCGTKYLKETIQNKIQEIHGQVSISGAVETVTGNAEKERLIKNAETYTNIREFDKALQTYIQITKQFPDDYRGWWGMFTTPVNRYFLTGQFREYEKNALRNACRLCRDRTVIDNYFTSIFQRYGNTIRTVPCKEKVSLHLSEVNYVPPKPDAFTEWLIFHQAYNMPCFPENFKRFILYLSQQYNTMTENGALFVDERCPQPTLARNSSFWFFPNVSLPSYVSFIAAMNHTKYRVTPISDAPNAPVFFKIGREDCFVDVTAIRGFYGKWIFATNYKGEKITILSSCVLSKTDLYKHINHCQYCGGKFKGAFTKVCSECGKPKDY